MGENIGSSSLRQVHVLLRPHFDLQSRIKLLICKVESNKFYCCEPPDGCQKLGIRAHLSLLVRFQGLTLAHRRLCAVALSNWDMVHKLWK